MSVVVAPEVAQFVAAVRAELADLDPEVVEELTGGLEADLTDSLEAAPGDGFGDPAAYAAELRSAAGLPPRPAAPVRLGALGTAALAGVLVQRGGAAVERVTGHPRWPAVRDFVVTLRPVWWVVRAWVAYWGICEVGEIGPQPVWLPSGSGQLAFLVVLAVVSVQLGRRAVGGSLGRWRWPILVGNLLAVVVLAPAVLALDDRPVEVYPAAYDDGASGVPDSGLYLNGNPVTNVRPYDAQGRPLGDVQLFDQDGNPLEVGPNSSNNTAVAPDGMTESVPRLDADGEPRWNIFPLQQRPTDPLNPPTPVPTAVDPLPQAPSASPSEPAPSGASPSGASPSGASPLTAPSASAPASPGASASASPSATPTP